MRTVWGLIIAGLVIFSLSLGIGMLWVESQPQDTYLWVQAYGTWQRVLPEAMSEGVCASVLSHVQPDYPEFFLICLPEGVTPLNTLSI